MTWGLKSHDAIDAFQTEGITTSRGGPGVDSSATPWFQVRLRWMEPLFIKESPQACSTRANGLALPLPCGPATGHRAPQRLGLTAPLTEELLRPPDGLCLLVFIIEIKTEICLKSH